MQQILLLQVFFSERFSWVVRRIWHGPIFRFYIKLYGYFLFANFLMFVTFTPFLERFYANYRLPEVMWQSLRLLNAVTYFCVSSTVLYLHWKTNYRVATVADSGSRSGADESFAHPLLSLDLPR